MKSFITNSFTKFSAVSFCLFIFNGCVTSYIDRSRILNDIDDHKNVTAKNASYSQPYEDVYGAMYSVISAKYNIARESESRGYIETDIKEVNKSTYETREKITGEIIGRNPPYRVSFICDKEKRTRKEEGGLWTEWKKPTRDIKKENKLKIEVYERLTGKIKLTPGLIQRIETFNNDPKHKKKIIY